ncbi:MAG: hypothetical protein ACXAEX_01080, partial [Promethearchaeota archaeon]
ERARTHGAGPACTTDPEEAIRRRHTGSARWPGSHSRPALTYQLMDAQVLQGDLKFDLMDSYIKSPPLTFHK